jgi:hypothetical protein
MLAAAALTALLMTALLQVVASIGRGRRALERSDHGPAASWRADLLESLRWDLTNARSAVFEPDRLTLTGHGALDPATLAPGHEPVTVVYETDSLANRPWLVRRQSARGGGGSVGRPWSELLCPDVVAFSVEPSVGGLPAPAAAPRAVPAAVRVRVEWRSGPPTDQLIVLR